MLEIKNTQNLITTTELAKQLNTSNNTITNAVKKCLPNKLIEKGKIAYYNKEEATIILDYIKKSSNRQDLTTYKTSLISTKTGLENQLIQHQLIEQTNQLNPLERIKLANEIMAKSFQEIIESQQIKIQSQQETINDFNLVSRNRQVRQELRKRINEKVREVAKTDGNFKDMWSKLYGAFDKLHNGVNYKTEKNKLEYLIDHGYGDELLEILLTRF